MPRRVSREIDLNGCAAHISSQNEQDSPIYYQTGRSEFPRDERKTIASFAASQAINGRAAHSSGQLLTLQVKKCSLFRSFTSITMSFIVLLLPSIKPDKWK